MSLMGDMLRGGIGGFMKNPTLGGFIGGGLAGAGISGFPQGTSGPGGGWINLPGKGGPGVGIDLPGLPRIGVGERTTPGGINFPGTGAPGIGIGPVTIGAPAPGAATSSLPFVGAIGIQPEYRNQAIATVPQEYRRRGVRYVLAADGLFYPRQMVPKQYRAWKPDPKPPITVRDHKAILRADSARKRVKNVAQRAGLRMTTSSRSTSKKKGRK